MVAVRKSLSNGAFTLVELLVSITIVGLLAGLSTVGIQKAIDAGNRTKDLSMLKQVGIGIMSYVGDNDGFLPGPIPTPVRAYVERGGDTTPYLLPERLWPYMGKNVSDYPKRFPAVAEFMLFQAAKKSWGKKTVQKAQDITILATRRGSATMPYLTQRGEYDEDPWGWQETRNASSGNRPKKLAAIPNPALTWALRDVDLESEDEGATERSKANLTPTPLHGNVRLHLYFDGHVEARPRTESDKKK